MNVHLILLLIPLLWYGRLGDGELTHPASIPVLVVLGCRSQPPLGPSPNQFPLMQDRASPARSWPVPSASPSLMPMWAAVFSSVACAPLHARAPALPRLRLCLQPCTSGQVSDDASMVDLGFGFGCAGFGEVRWTLDSGCGSFVDQRPCIMYRSDAEDLRRRGL